MSPTVTATNRDAYKAILSELVWPVVVAWQLVLDSTEKKESAR